MSVSGTSGSEPPQTGNFVTRFIGKVTNPIVHNPERRKFLQTVATAGASGGVLTLAGERALSWLFADDPVLENLKKEITPLLEVGNKSEAKEIVNRAISEYSENGDYERVGRIAMLAKEIDGEKVSDPKLNMPTEEAMAQNRAARIQELVENMGEQEIDSVLASLVDGNGDLPKTKAALEKKSANAQEEVEQRADN